MIKRLKPWSFRKHILLSVIAVVVARFAFHAFPLRQAASIGIIGGADGPTSIFIASNVASAYIYYIVYFVAFILLLLLYKPLKFLIDKQGRQNQ